MRRCFGLLAAAVLLFPYGAGAQELDSQYVLERYGLALELAGPPHAVIFNYDVSQLGPSNIEQGHTVYRSGLNVRDEMRSLDGTTLRHKIVRISHFPDRYAVEAVAPRTDAYELLFLGSVKDGRHLDYVYEATPLGRPSGAVVDRVTIDGQRFLPRAVQFRTSGPQATGSGMIEYAPVGGYWLPVVAGADATVDGKPARERITWSGYRFPKSLPPWTFVPPKPLPHPTIPPL